MSRARDLSRFANQQAISIDSSLNVGINSSSPDAKLDVAGIVSATEFYGDGSNLTGVSSPGLGTALSDDTTSPLNSIYFTNANLSVASTITVNPPSSASAAFTQYANIVLQNDADLIVADGDTFIPDILGIGTDVEEPGTLTGGAGKLRVDNITDKAGTGAPNFPNGVVFTGLTTAPGGVQVATGATISGSTNTIIAQTNGSEAVRITSAGKVGIGTTNPDRVLHLSQANSTAYSGTDFDQDYHVLKLNNTTDDGTVGMQFLIGSDGEAAITASEVAGSATDLIFSTRSGGNKTEKLRIEAAGNIGIGTNNPGELLHMFSSGNLTLKIHTTGPTSPAVLQLKSPSNGRVDFVPGDSGSASGRILYSHVDDSLTFSTKQPGGNRTDRLGITSEGHVGINQISPSHRLQVEDGSSGVIVAKQTTNNGGYNIYEGDASDGTTKFYVTHNGRIGAADGIIFGSDTAAANILNDYEEGFFTPTIADGISNVSYTYAAGRYIKVGRLVTADFYMSFAGSSSANGSHIRIGSMPFIVSNDTYGSLGGYTATTLTRGGGTTSYQDLNVNDGIISFYGSANSATFYLYKGSSQSWTTVGSAVGKYIIGQYIYITD